MMSLSELRKTAGNANVIPVTLEFPADLLTPVSAYLRLSRGSSRAFLFESVEGGEHLARYSFLGVDPYACLKIEDGSLSLEKLGAKAPKTGSKKIRPQKIPGNPFAAIGNHLAKYRGARRPGLPPFTGGAVGYVGYESVQYLEDIKTPLDKAGVYDASLMLYRSVVAFDHVRRSVVLIHNIFLDEENWEAGYRRAQRELKKLQARLSRPAPSEVPLVLGDDSGKIPKLQATLGPEAFANAVTQVKKHIRQGDIFQCVLSDEFQFPFRGDTFAIYRSLRSTSPAPYLFHLALGEETLLGASPEMLTRVSGGRVESCPIAGTRPRGKDEAEDQRFERQLLESVKERAEHLMLVDLGRNDIGRVSRPGSVTVPEFMQVHRFSNVMHLVSRVEGKMDSRLSPWDALGSCFPAGTLSGAPKIRAMEIIADLEPTQRGPYGGAVVYADFSGSLDSCITIRSLFVREGVGRIRAGAGVVADSQASREYEEILNKTKAIRKAVTMATVRKKSS